MTFLYLAPSSSYQLATSNSPLAELGLPGVSQPEFFPKFPFLTQVFLALAVCSLDSSLYPTTTLQFSFHVLMSANFCHFLGKSLLFHFPTSSISKQYLTANESKWTNLSQSAEFCCLSTMYGQFARNKFQIECLKE